MQFLLTLVGASSAFRPDSPHDQRSASVAGRDSVVCSQEGAVREGGGGEEQKMRLTVRHQVMS